MGFLSKFEGKMEDTVEGAANKMSNAPLSPVQLAKKAEKQMRRERMVGAGKEYAPTLYTVLVNPDDDERLFGYYPTLAGEIETYLSAKASEQGLLMDGQPLVRFIVDDSLRHGKFDVIAEAVAAPIVAQLRNEEMQRYGLAPAPAARGDYRSRPARGAGADNRAPYDNYDSYDSYDDYAEYDNDSGYANHPEPQQGAYYDEHDYAPAEHPNAAARIPAVGPAAGVAGAGAAVAGAAGAAGAAVAAGAAAGAAAQTRAPHTMVFADGGDPQAAAERTHENDQARLIDTTNSRAYTLLATRLMLGRESKNDIVIPDINASRSHAELTRDAQGNWHLTDLGSTNGTLLNGYEIASEQLQEGDRITIGTTNYLFTYRK